MTTYREFENAIAEGVDCEQLARLRHQLPIQDKEAAAVQLLRIGCSDAREGFSPPDRQGSVHR